LVFLHIFTLFLLFSDISFAASNYHTIQWKI